MSNPVAYDRHRLARHTRKLITKRHTEVLSSSEDFGLRSPFIIHSTVHPKSASCLEISYFVRVCVLSIYSAGYVR